MCIPTTKFVEKLREKVRPYYTGIDEPEEYLQVYMDIHKDRYSKRRSSVIVGMFPSSRISSSVRWLDIGCGGGFYSLVAAQKGVNEIVVVDLRPVCVKAARLNIVRNADLKVHGVIGDAVRLPFREECFDVVLCVDLIEHVRDDKQLLPNARSIMKNDGFLIVATQNSSSLNYLIEGFFRRYVLKDKGWMGWDTTHLRFYDFRSLTKLLSEGGFKQIKVGGTYFIPYKLLSFALVLLSAKLSQGFSNVLLKINDMLEKRCDKLPWNVHGWGIICVCKKAIP